MSLAITLGCGTIAICLMGSAAAIVRKLDAIRGELVMIERRLSDRR